MTLPGSLYGAAKEVCFWLTVCTYFLSVYIDKKTPDERAAFALKHPRVWGLLVFLKGLGADSKRIRTGLQMFAHGMKSSPFTSWVALLPEPGETDTLTPPAPLGPLLAPPAPTPLALAAQRPAVSARYHYQGDELPPASRPGQSSERPTPKEIP